MLLILILSGCRDGGEELTKDLEESSYETEEQAESSPAASSELSGAYRQMAMYIQKGFRTYHVEGEYQAYFGPIEGGASGAWVDGGYVGTGDETDGVYYYCDILLEGESVQ